jgi:hypothetical protein
VVDNNVADINAHAELNPLVFWNSGVTLGHSPLDLDSASHRIHHAAELGKQSVAGVLDNPPTMLGDLGIDKRVQVVLELSMGAFLVQAGQAAVASYIGRKDSNKSTLDPTLPRSDHNALLSALFYTEQRQG